MLPATPADACFLWQLFQACRASFLPLPESLLRLQFAAWERMLQEQYPGAERLILHQEPIRSEYFGEPVGAAITYRTPTGDTRLVDLSILPAFQGCGIGTAFLRGLQERGEPILLFVAIDNIGARRLYTRLGFHPVETVSKESTPLIYQEMIWTAS